MAVYWVLFNAYQKRRGDDVETITTLRERIDMSYGTFVKNLRILANEGLIAIRRSTARRGKTTWRSYDFTLLPVPDASYDRLTYIAGETERLAQIDTRIERVANFESQSERVANFESQLSYVVEDDGRACPDPEKPQETRARKTKDKGGVGGCTEYSFARENDPLAGAFPTPNVSAALTLFQQLAGGRKPGAHPKRRPRSGQRRNADRRASARRVRPSRAPAARPLSAARRRAVRRWPHAALVVRWTTARRWSTLGPAVHLSRADRAPGSPPGPGQVPKPGDDEDDDDEC